MLKRKLTKVLENWLKSGHEKALLLTGARQVGKTTAVREFAGKFYKHFVEVNFVKNPIAKRAFDGGLSTAEIVMNLSAMGYGPFNKGETLIFLDEIQECPNARTAIKFLVEEGLFDIIESGSLLGINYKPVASYPVGFEEEVKVFPLDFEEFLWARNIGDEVIGRLRDSYQNLQPIPDFIHQQISKFYREYLVVGGMPEVVQKFVTDPDFQKTLKLQKNILTTYRSDITNYAGNQQVLVKRIFDAMPSELGKEDKRFVLANLEKGASLRKYEDPTQWLVDAGIAYYSINTRSFELPFEAVENRRLFKLYMVDTGLLCSNLLKNMQFQVMNGDISINEGALTENFVAATLSAKQIPLHYYDKKSRQELDFVFPENGKISIIEVKSGDDYKRHASMDAAIREHKSEIERAIVLCKGNVAKDDVLYLPQYMSMFL
ncbi:MAG: AAA family ATPase [Fibrobacter sp.]|nr:AAA family ATPase [Fibrobacter sp.]